MEEAEQDDHHDSGKKVKLDEGRSYPKVPQKNSRCMSLGEAWGFLRPTSCRALFYYALLSLKEPKICCLLTRAQAYGNSV